jgi:hypothetical protein
VYEIDWMQPHVRPTFGIGEGEAPRLVNTQTLVVTILTLWLVMGLGFLAYYAKARKTGQSLTATLKSNEGLLFIASVVGSILYFILAG